MENNVTALKLFTLSACPLGKSMGMVMNEVQGRYASLQIDTIYVELSAQEANDFRIKKNPTTLFLNDGGEELYRVEGFAETEVIIQHIDQLNEGVFMKSEKLMKNEQTVETYTVYMLENNELAAVEQTYTNETSIAAPRIHAIFALLQARRDNMTNVFPAHSELVSVQFSDGKGRIEIRYANKSAAESSFYELRRMALLKTLHPFHVTEVELVESYETVDSLG
ncbi:hypothetical protein [Paenibacillus sp. IITD108]|uniref:hypothetical protein n=1 Tax=Paenibacillus sp. IITD108 TaxID=3116649 RepID=UPI002F40F8BF